ncbi:MAG: hypothetical protein U0T74_00345 [Chitinophagales bacterium]
MFLETLHGTARILLLVPLVGDFRARQVTVFTGALLVFAITTLFIRWLKPSDGKQCLSIGAMWVLLTLCFEIGLGLYVFGMTTQRILEDYNLPAGGLMPIGLLLMFLTPLLAAKLREVV